MKINYKLKNNDFEDDGFILTYLITFIIETEIQINFCIEIHNENYLEFKTFVDNLNKNISSNFFYEENNNKFIAFNLNEQNECEIYISDICFINNINDKKEIVNLFNALLNHVNVMLNI